MWEYAPQTGLLAWYNLRFDVVQMWSGLNALNHGGDGFLHHDRRDHQLQVRGAVLFSGWRVVFLADLFLPKTGQLRKDRGQERVLKNTPFLWSRDGTLARFRVRVGSQILCAAILGQGRLPCPARLVEDLHPTAYESCWVPSCMFKRVYMSSSVEVLNISSVGFSL